MDAEVNLTGTNSDVLVIFDCCHAGVICKPAWRGSRRSFEYLVATNESGRTRVAGEQSFTTALIWALKSLKSRPGFHTTDLVGAIKKAPSLPQGQYPHLYGSRFDPCAEHIYIAPMHSRDSGEASPVGQFRDEQERDLSSQEVVDLRIYLPLEDDAKPAKRFDAVKKFAGQFKGLIEGNHVNCSRVQLLDKDFRLTEWTAAKLWKAKSGFGRKPKDRIEDHMQEVQPDAMETDNSSDLNTLTQTSADEKPKRSPRIAKRTDQVRRSPRTLQRSTF